MVTELINTGSELLLGRVLNTHQQWIGQQMATLGMPVGRQVSVADRAEAIGTAVAEALHRADLVITTGGLGPTSDDRTRDWIAALLGLPLREDAGIVAAIHAYFEARGRQAPASTRVQALVPSGADVFPNHWGTAPGLAFWVTPNHLPSLSKAVGLILLPGPPKELQPMFHASAIPWIQSHFPDRPGFACQTLRTVGLGESVVEERLQARWDPDLLEGVEVGYCARMGEVDIRFTMSGASARLKVGECLGWAREILSPWVIGEEGASLEATVVERFRLRGRTLALAESCTGGLLAHRITNVPGASRVFLAGWVTYSNGSKVSCLGVCPDALERHGAVSAEVAGQMARGARQRGGTDVGLSITGIAGPDGGSVDKPVGTVHLGFDTATVTSTRLCRHPYDRETFKQMSTQVALQLLLEWIDSV